jgi:hypothetical protein
MGMVTSKVAADLVDRTKGPFAAVHESAPGPQETIPTGHQPGPLTLMSFVKHCGHDRDVLHARQREVD